LCFLPLNLPCLFLTTFFHPGIQDDIVLHRHKQSEPITGYNEKEIRKVRKVVDFRHKEYMKSQKDILRNKLEKNANQHIVMQEKNHALLETCKKWNGPCMNVKDLDLALSLCKTQNISEKFVLKKEISFRKIMCPTDTVERPELYKLNLLTPEKLKENLSKLLNTELCVPVEMPDPDEVTELVKAFFNIT
jgi:hypothetical protein